MSILLEKQRTPRVFSTVVLAVESDMEKTTAISTRARSLPGGSCPTWPYPMPPGVPGPGKPGVGTNSASWLSLLPMQ